MDTKGGTALLNGKKHTIFLILPYRGQFRATLTACYLYSGKIREFFMFQRLAGGILLATEGERIKARGPKNSSADIPVCATTKNQACEITIPTAQSEPTEGIPGRRHLDVALRKRIRISVKLCYHSEPGALKKEYFFQSR